MYEQKTEEILDEIFLDFAIETLENNSEYRE